MKTYSTSESKGLAGLGIVWAVVMAWLFFFIEGSAMQKGLMVSLGVIPAVLMVWWGFRAVQLVFEGDELYVLRGNAPALRLPISGVTSIRCGPDVADTRVVIVKHESGGTFHTLVKVEDIVPIMALVPDRALTIYWREMVTEGRTHF